MKVAVTKVIDTLTQEEFDGAFQKLLERYNKCIAAGGDYFEGEQSVCTISKIANTKKVWKLIACSSYIFEWGGYGYEFHWDNWNFRILRIPIEETHFSKSVS